MQEHEGAMSKGSANVDVESQAVVAGASTEGFLLIESSDPLLIVYWLTHPIINYYYIKFLTVMKHTKQQGTFLDKYTIYKKN